MSIVEGRVPSGSTDTGPLLAQANAASDRGDWHAAAVAYRQLLSLSQDSLEAWVGLGRALKANGDWIQAVLAYGRALALGGEDPEILAALGDLHETMGHRHEAMNFYRRSENGSSAVHPPPTSAAPARRSAWRFWSNRNAMRLALVHGDAARDRGVWVLAIDHYRRYLQFRPNNFGIWVQLGHVLKEAGRYTEAGEAYGQARRLNPRDADLLLNMGHLCKMRGDRSAAVDLYRQSFGLDQNAHARAELEGMGFTPDPAFVAPLPVPAVASQRASIWRRYLARRRAAQSLTLALAARDRHMWQASVEGYQQYLAVRPDDFAIWVQLGHALKESGRPQDARAAYGEALRRDPLDADLLLNLGHLHKVMGEPQLARDYYEQSFKQDGNRFARDELTAIQTRG